MLATIRSDNAAEFQALAGWGGDKGIEMEYIEASTPVQNGVTERLNRTLLETSKAIMIEANMPKQYWKYAVQTAKYLRNVSVVVSDTDGKTPFEM